MEWKAHAELPPIDRRKAELRPAERMRSALDCLRRCAPLCWCFRVFFIAYRARKPPLGARPEFDLLRGRLLAAARICRLPNTTVRLRGSPLINSLPIHATICSSNVFEFELLDPTRKASLRWLRRFPLHTESFPRIGKRYRVEFERRVQS